MGGKREIAACRNCNSTYGHTFEAEVAKSLLPLHAALSGWGIPLKGTDVIWRKAIVHEEKPFDLSVKDGEVSLRLSHRLPKRDITGKLVAIECPSLEDAKKAIRERARKQPMDIESVPIKDTIIRSEEIKGTRLTLEVGYSLRKLALKCAWAFAHFCLNSIQKALQKLGRDWDTTG